MHYETITADNRDGWLDIRLALPASRNALSGDMVEELLTLLDATAGDMDVRGITLRGNGDVFCAGGDLKGFNKHLDADARASIEAASRRAGALFHRIDRMPQVVIMCVHGAAIAGGFGVMCAGDVVIAMRGTQFALTETRLGIVPAQIAPLVVARAGPAVARRLMLTGARFDADAAAAGGIVDMVVDSAAAMDATEARVRRDVLACAPGAVAATKALLRRLHGTDAEAAIELAAGVFAERLASDEGREGIASFLEKRKPRWVP